MRIIITEEIEKLMQIYEPYQEGCHLVDNAPKEAIEAKKKVLQWFREQEGDCQ